MSVLRAIIWVVILCTLPSVVTIPIVVFMLVRGNKAKAKRKGAVSERST